MTTNDRDSFFSRAIADPDEAGGRYAKLNPSKVTGSTPTVPQQPAKSPWACDPVPLEPPVGFSFRLFDFSDASLDAVGQFGFR
jgi:hypothetical protein